MWRNKTHPARRQNIVGSAQDYTGRSDGHRDDRARLTNAQELIRFCLNSPLPNRRVTHDTSTKLKSVKLPVEVTGSDWLRRDGA